jgi:hypothetical protein
MRMIHESSNIRLIKQLAHFDSLLLMLTSTFLMAFVMAFLLFTLFFRTKLKEFVLAFFDF